MKLIKRVTAVCEKRIVDYPILFKLYSFPYKHILQREIALAGITNKDRVLNIGCGAVPFSAIYTSRITGAEVVGLDFDAEACRRAVKTVSEMGLADSIIIRKGDGARIDPSGFTVVLVALQAAPKKKILENLLKQGASGLRIIFRLPRSFFENQYGTIGRNNIICDDVRQYMITFNRSVLIRK